MPSLFDFSMLGLTLVGAACGVILVLQAMGLDIRMWNRMAVMETVAIPQAQNPRRVRLWLLLLLFLFNLVATGIVWYRTQHPAEPVITTGNVETYVRSWLQEFRYPFVIGEEPDYYFEFAMQLPDGHRMIVRRPKQRDRYLFVVAQIDLAPQDASHFAQFSPTDQARLNAELGLEMAREEVQGNAHLPDPILVAATVPITTNLTAQDLLKAIGTVDDGVVALSDVIELRMLSDTK